MWIYKAHSVSKQAESEAPIARKNRLQWQLSAKPAVWQIYDFCTEVLICCKAGTPTLSHNVSFTSQTVAVNSVTPSVSVAPTASASATSSASITPSMAVNAVSSSNINTIATLDLFSPARDCKCHLSSYSTSLWCIVHLSDLSFVHLSGVLYRVFNNDCTLLYSHNQQNVSKTYTISL